MKDLTGRLAADSHGRIGRITRKEPFLGLPVYHGVGLFDGQPWRAGNPILLEPAAEAVLLQFCCLQVAVRELHDAAFWSPDHDCDGHHLWSRVRAEAGIPQPA